MTIDAFKMDDLNILLGIFNGLMNTTMTFDDLLARAPRTVSAKPAPASMSNN